MEALTVLLWMFDAVLAILLLWLAWRALTCPDHFEAIVLFIAFGLLMALSWVRLDAPDVALAEAAIGAGLTGVLLLGALVGLRSREFGDGMARGGQRTERHPTYPRLLVVIILLAVFAGLALVILTFSARADGLGPAVAANLAASGVANPVTAVLLNFRGYDTLLEMVVLLTAVLGIWSLRLEPFSSQITRGPVLDSLSRFLVPMMILVAAYLLWVGSHASGGAFQSGSVLGAAGVLLLLAGWRLRVGLASAPLRIVLVAGPGAFLVLALFTLLVQGRLLEYPEEHAGSLILVIETIATVSIGATLAALYLGGRPAEDEEPR